MFGITPRVHPAMSCVVTSPSCDFLDGTEDMDDDDDGMRRRLSDDDDDLPAVASGVPFDPFKEYHYKERYDDFMHPISEHFKDVRPDSNNIFLEENKRQFPESEVFDHMKRTYRACHGSALLLGDQFLKLKQSQRDVVYSSLSLTDIFDRISTKRPICFYGKRDLLMLRNGVLYNFPPGLAPKPSWGNDWRAWTKLSDWNDFIEEHSEQRELYLSYDEMILSALTSVSSPTHFINSCLLKNGGELKYERQKYERQGIYMGLVGARFEKPNVMEHSLMMISMQQNSVDNGYGPDNPKKPPIFELYEKFYSKSYFPIWTEVEAQRSGYMEISVKGEGYKYLDVQMWLRRIRITLELFLMECDYRAGKFKKLYCSSSYWIQCNIVVSSS